MKRPGAEELRRAVPFVIAGLMGLLAMVLTSQWVAQQRKDIEEERRQLRAGQQKLVDIVVAAQDIHEDVPLETADLATTPIPEGFVQPYASQSPKELLGMVTLVPMAKGEQVLSNKLRRADLIRANATLSGVTPKGKRAVTIQSDAVSGVGGLVRPGDKVDILWTIKLPQASQQEAQILTFTLFQDVPVLAIGANVAGRPSAKKEEEGSSQNYTVTLALTPQETSFLLFAREQGRIQLSLRSGLETGRVAVAPANIGSLMESVLGIPQQPAVPQKPPPRTVSVEVYKGTKREVVVLPEGE